MLKSFKDIINYDLRNLKTVEDFDWNGSEKPEEYLETKFKVLELKNKKIIFLVTDFVALLFFAICLIKTIPNTVRIPILLILGMIIMLNIKKLESKPNMTENNVVTAIDELRNLVREDKFYKVKERAEVIELLSTVRNRLYVNKQHAEKFDRLMAEMDITIVSLRTKQDMRYAEVEKLRRKLDYRMSEVVMSSLRDKLESLRAENTPSINVCSKATAPTNILVFPR